MSVRRTLGFILACAALPLNAAASYTVLVDSGSIIVGKATAGRISVSDSAMVTLGDTVSVHEARSACVIITEDTKLMLTDSCILSLSGTEMALQVNLIKGQVFLLHEAISGPGVTILANNCSFAPVGTAAAIRLIKNENPSVAVLKGSIRAIASTGETIDVGEGAFGTFDIAANSFKQGSVSVTTLEKLKALAQKTAQVGMPSPEPPAPPADTAKPAVEQSAAAQPEVAQPAPVAQAPASQPVAATATPAAPVAEPQKPAKNSKTKKQTESQATAGSGPAPTAPTVEKPTDEKAAADTAAPGTGEKPKDESAAGGKPGIVKELSASYVTVGSAQWMRIAFFMDIPIWRFGLGLDLELFLDEKGMPSNKGWNFIDEPVEAVFRKLRYIRFNHENDKVFMKFGGIDNVTLGYGFVVDRFTNMLHYPSEKLLGLQLYLNDLTPIGFTLQTMVADFKDFGNDGGVVAGRLAIKPLGLTKIPLLNRLSIGGTYATDLNQYAPARDWDYTMTGSRWDRDEDGATDSTFYYNKFHNKSYYNALRSDQISDGDFDTIIEHRDQWASRAENNMSIIGADVGIPIIESKLISLTVYGQMGMTYDDQSTSESRDTVVASGWGIGAPGVALNVGPLNARVEYRRVQGEFMPGYFNTYYLNERIVRDPEIRIKEASLIDQNLNGVFGTLGFNIGNILTLTGTYQCLVADDTTSLETRDIDQRFEAMASVGDMLIQKIPKVKKAEGFIYKTNIKRTDMNPLTEALDKDAFFQFTPFMYWGFRAGVEVLPNTLILWESRFGKKWNDNSKLVDDNQILISAGLTF
jgi:hypothetical protein